MCPGNGEYRGLRVLIRELIGARRIVTVSGSQSGVGKTSLAEIVLRSLSDFAAIKVTITDKAGMVTDDEREIMVPRTDTWRMKESGAVQVVWIKSSEDALAESLKSALVKIGPCRGILVEGNSILRHLHPTIALFVVTALLHNMKPSRVQALQKADVCVINQINNKIPSREILESISRQNPGLSILAINLLDPLSTSGHDYDRLLTLLKERTG